MQTHALNEINCVLMIWYQCMLNPELATQKNFNGELPIHKAFVFIQRDDKRQRWKQLELLRIILDENPETVSQPDRDGNLTNGF